MATTAYETHPSTPIWELGYPEGIGFRLIRDEKAQEDIFQIGFGGEIRGEATINWGRESEVSLERPAYWDDDVSEYPERKEEFQKMFRGIFTQLTESDPVNSVSPIRLEFNTEPHCIDPVVVEAIFTSGVPRGWARSFVVRQPSTKEQGIVSDFDV